MGLDMSLYRADNNGDYSWKEDELAYWRKANHIHRWFVENVQNGIDECEDHEVSREKVVELLGICDTVLDSIELVDGEVWNGQRYENGEWVDILVKGRTVKNPEVAQRLLPTTSGFFFGGTDYDEYYVGDIIETAKVLEEILSTFDFENNKLIYSSSW